MAEENIYTKLTIWQSNEERSDLYAPQKSHGNFMA